MIPARAESNDAPELNGYDPYAPICFGGRSLYSHREAQSPSYVNWDEG
jgi:hypothetical protein